MAHSFSFGFASEDIEDEEMPVTGAVETTDEDRDMHDVGNTTLLRPRLHTLEEMLSTLPSQLSYSSHDPTSNFSLPRRTLFDIRAQLMAEDESPNLSSVSPLVGLSSTNDITPTIYEGGFKTWECAVDLTQFLAQAIEDGALLPSHHRDVHIIELGAGTALPSTYLLSTILATSCSAKARLASQRPVTVTLCDYNPDVLTHASIPNLLLAFASRHPDLQPFPEEDTVEVPASLKTAFTTNLASAEVSVNGVSGAWGPLFGELVKSAGNENGRTRHKVGTTRAPKHTLILASETLYSPSSLSVFTSTLMALLTPSPPPTEPWPASSVGGHATSLREGKDSSTALVASKKVYFGVGGGVDEFLVLVERAGGWARVVWDSDWGGDEGGVGRCILEVGRSI